VSCSDHELVALTFWEDCREKCHSETIDEARSEEGLLELTGARIYHTNMRIVVARDVEGFVERSQCQQSWSPRNR
jgi:hypothetical protein